MDVQNKILSDKIVKIITRK